MLVSKSSSASRISKKTARAAQAAPRWWHAPAIALLLLLLGSGAAAWCYSQGYLLYFGDAQAHLTVARRIVDSRQPGYDQLGTVWLPLPHALMLPLVRNDFFWKTGLAGAVPSVICFVLAGVFLFATVRRIFQNVPAALAATLVFALNPNLLYLQSIPMTEAVFFGALLGLLYASVCFGQTRSWWAVIGAGIASEAASLTRYEGWFLIPFVALYFLVVGQERRWRAAVLFSALAGLAPLYWLGHNWLMYGDALEFYHGQYSAMAIYQRALKAGMKRYAGDHDWLKAWLYFRTAAELVANRVVVWLGLAGVALTLARRIVWPLMFLTLPSIFYIWSIHSSGVPIFVPMLWPNGYYNTRYALAVLPLFALASAGLVTIAPVKLRNWMAGAVVIAAAVPWLLHPGPESWICWKESQVNSEARRAWTKQAADYLGPRYHPGSGIYSCTGDISGIFREAGIPLRETLNEGDNPAWMAVAARPDLFLHEQWAISVPGCAVGDALLKLPTTSAHYRLRHTVSVKGAEQVEIYEREANHDEHPVY